MTDIFTEKFFFLPLLFGALCENGEVCFADEICVEEDVGFRDFCIYLQSFYIILSCTRQIESELSLRSFAKHLYNT